MTTLLSVADYSVDYITQRSTVRALDEVNLTLPGPVVVGIVGESGSGKSTLGLSIGRMLPTIAECVGGDLKLEGNSMLTASYKVMRKLRRKRLGFVFQDPMTALDPTMKIGRQIALAMGDGCSSDEINELLSHVGLTDASRIAAKYPHQLSGGMAQRVVIAIAISRQPALLVADEPTASLDATLRDHILELLVSLCTNMNTGIVLLSHELRVVARHCEQVAVMYAGRVVENGKTSIVFAHPAHAYTHALLAAAPGLERPGETLQSIPGAPPVLSGKTEGCGFEPRCHFASECCRFERPAARSFSGRIVLCHNAEKVLNSDMQSRKER
ncbi:MAG: ATP-binding cassette domain-containing protein [Woeseiaceae bacterium]|nr:ATP-binding cassette domain-containing protein [Woeseiaceae bacterium]